MYTNGDLSYTERSFRGTGEEKESSWQVIRLLIFMFNCTCLLTLKDNRGETRYLKYKLTPDL